MTHSKMRHQGLTQPLVTPSLRHPPSPSPSHSVCLLPPPAGKHTLEIRDFKYISVCVSMYVHPFLVNFNFVGAFEDSAGFIQDALTQRGSWHCV